MENPVITKAKSLITDNRAEDRQISQSLCVHDWVPERWRLEVRDVLVEGTRTLVSLQLGSLQLKQEADGTLMCKIEETGVRW